MRSWHLQLNSHDADRKAGLRLFGLLLASLAIHITVIVSSTHSIQWEQGGVDSLPLQVRISKIDNQVNKARQSSAQEIPLQEQTPHKAQKKERLAPVERRLQQTIVTTTLEPHPANVPTRQGYPPEKAEIGKTIKLTTQATQATQEKITATVPHPVVTTKLTNKIDEIQDVSSNDNDQERKQFVQHLQQALARHFNYPNLARRRNWQGEVILSVTLMSDGNFKNVTIASSSGYRMLDRAALASLQKVGQLEYGPIQVIDLEIPVIYQLQDS